MGGFLVGQELDLAELVDHVNHVIIEAVNPHLAHLAQSDVFFGTGAFRPDSELEVIADKLVSGRVTDPGATDLPAKRVGVIIGHAFFCCATADLNPKNVSMYADTHHHNLPSQFNRLKATNGNERNDILL
ncbi:MAG: hypothetical protein C3F02_01735 [Parcubacteria group bacterium]|nr:MAG: hypothetical protein C3F02_01735 [Parcubacteria group bacterium]